MCFAAPSGLWAGAIEAAGQGRFAAFHGGVNRLNDFVQAMKYNRNKWNAVNVHMESENIQSGTSIDEYGMSAPSVSRPIRLTSEQIKALKRGFPRVHDTPEQAAERSWRGMTLEAIVEKFSEEQGQPVSARVVRHHYKQLKSDHNPPVPLGQGKNKAAALQRVTIIPAHANLRALTKVVWTFTRFSIPEIYRLYDPVAKMKGWKLVAIQNFRKIIKDLGIEGIKNTPSMNLMERHSLRVLQHSIRPTDDSRNTWIVLAAIEPITGHINVVIYKLPEESVSPGLSAADIAGFIEDTIERLALPIHQLELYGVTTATLADLDSKLPDQRMLQCDPSLLEAEYTLPNDLNTAGKFCNFLSEAVNAYNENVANSRLIEARKTIYDENSRVKEASNGWSSIGIRLRYPDTNGEKLMQFCDKHFKTKDAVSKVRSIILKMLRTS